MTVNVAPVPSVGAFQSSIDLTGNILAGGTIKTYASGTSTPLATYSDPLGTTPNATTIDLDNNSLPSTGGIYLDITLSYKFIWFDSQGVQVDVQDNITGNPYAVALTGDVIPGITNTYTLGSSSKSWAQLFLGPNEVPAFNELTGNIGYYEQTEAEIAAAVTIVNGSISPGNILRYGSNTTPGTTDMTVALQAAIDQNNQGGVAVYCPRGTYNISSKVTLYAATKITGDGWAANAGSFTPSAGTIFNWTGTGVFLSLQGVSTGNYAEALCMRDFAIYNSGGIDNCTGIQMLFAPFSSLTNIYIGGFQGTGIPGTNGTGIEQGDSSWHCIFNNVIIQGCTTSLNSHDAGEDSNYNNCVFRSFNYTAGVGVYLNGQAQTNKFTDCDLSDNIYGCLISQSDSNGDGTGIPLPMQVTFDTCQFEQCNNFAIGISVSNQSFANNKAYPSVITTNCRFYIPASGGSVTPNNGQAIVYAQACSQITIQHPNESGYSYGAIIGISQFGFTFSGAAKPGPVIFSNDNGYFYGTGRIISSGQNGSLVTIPGDHALVRFTPTSMTTGVLAAIPFSVLVGADTWGWSFVSGVTTIRPTKNQTVRFKCQLAFASGPATNYLLQLFKNSVLFQTIAATTLGTAGNPFVLSGEAFDIPNGTSDFYYMVITTGSAGTVDITNSYFESEVVGE